MVAMAARPTARQLQMQRRPPSPSTLIPCKPLLFAGAILTDGQSDRNGSKAGGAAAQDAAEVSEPVDTDSMSLLEPLGDSFAEHFDR